MAKLLVGKVQLRKTGAFTVVGYNQFIDNVNSILTRTQAEALKKAAIEAAKPLHTRAIAEAPYDPNRKVGFHLKDAIFLAPGKPDKADVLVGVSRSRRKTGKPAAPHGILIESGTNDRFKKSGASTGKVNADPFFKRAMAASKDQVAIKLVDGMKVAVFGGIKP